MSTMQLGLSIALAAIVTVASRFIAFILFPTGRKVPDFIHWLSDKLPRMTMIMLVIYCLKDVSFTAARSPGCRRWAAWPSPAWCTCATRT